MFSVHYQKLETKPTLAGFTSSANIATKMRRVTHIYIHRRTERQNILNCEKCVVVLCKIMCVKKAELYITRFNHIFPAI